MCIFGAEVSPSSSSGTPGSGEQVGKYLAWWTRTLVLNSSKVQGSRAHSLKIRLACGPEQGRVSRDYRV